MEYFFVHHIPIIAHMPLIDIQILAVCRMFVTWP